MVALDRRCQSVSPPVVGLSITYLAVGARAVIGVLIAVVIFSHLEYWSGKDQ
jgi:hypothetical protein